MKKALGQTVRDLKREVNKKVLKVPSIEQKTLDATSNEPWGPHGSLLPEIAQATRNYHDYQLIMAVLWKRIQDTGKNWRHVYKALSVLEYLVIHGSERVVDDTREHAYHISTLSDFMYTDSNGRDQGSNVRRRSESLVALVNNKERLLEVRHKALSNEDKNHNSGASRPPLSSSAPYNDEYFEGREGDRENGHASERDANYRVHASGDYQYRPRSQSVDGYTNNSFDDYDRHSTRSDGGRDAEILHDERIDVPPSYEEATKNSWSDVQNDKDRGIAMASLQKASSPTGPKETSRGTYQALYQSVAGESSQAHEKEIDSFDEFDPRGSVSAATTVASNGLELDIFGLSAVDYTDSSALMLVTSTTTSKDDMLANSGLGDNFDVDSTTHAVPSKPEENPFGDAPFKAMLEDFPSEPHASASVTSQASGFVSVAEIHFSVEKKMEATQSYDFGNTMGGPIYAPNVVDRQNPNFYASEFSAANSNEDILDGILPWTGHVASDSFQDTQPAAQSHFLLQQGFSAYAASHSHQNSSETGSADLQTGQINQFEQPGLSNYIAGQENPFACQTFQPASPVDMDANQMNYTQKPVLSEQQTSQEAPVSSYTVQSGNPNIIQTYGLQHPAQAPVSTHASQAAFPYGIQAAQGPSSPQMSQASVAVHAGQSTAPANYQGSQINPSQQLNLSTTLPSQTTPVSFPPASRSDSHVARIKDLNQLGLLAPQTSQLASGPFQAVHSSVPVNEHGAQMNPLQQARLSALPAQAAPVSSKTFQLEASLNQQPMQLNPLQQPVMSAPQASLGVSVSSEPFQSSAPTNIQAAQINPSLQHGSSDPLTLDAPMAIYQPFRPVAPTSLQEAQIYPLLQGISAPIASQNTLVLSQAAQQALPSNIQTGQSSFTPQSALPDLMGSLQESAKTEPSKKKFEPKSAVWAETISRGLVNLNISGPKTNPLADIGIDFDDINRKEKRNEVKSSQTLQASTIAMGKAMGAGSGVGRVGASAFAPPQNPTMGMGMSGGGMGMVMGMGGYGGNMNQPYMGMGMGMGVNMGTNMGRGMNMGQMPLPSGMPQQGSDPYNPMNDGGGYGQQQPYGGGRHR